MHTDVVYGRTSSRYYADLSKHPVLTKDQEQELLRRYRTCPHCSQSIPNKVRRTHCTECGHDITQTREDYYFVTCPYCETRIETHYTPTCCFKCGHGRDYTAREQLVNGNLRFVVRMARSITKDPARVQLLTSAGNVGLLVAIDKFEAEKDTRFLTYAAWWIRKEMFDEIQSSGIVHVPSHKQKSARKAQKTGIYVCENCGLRLDPEVDPRGVKNKCIKGKQHEFILRECDEVLSPTISIDDTLTLSISADVNVEEQVIDTSVAALIRNALRCIPMRARDKYILLQYYDIPETSRRTASKGLFQLSEVAGITPERVRQIKEKLLREIRIELRRMSVNNMTDVIAVC